MRKNLEEETDEELMLAYQKGDIMAYEILYKRHSPRIYGYIRKQIGEEIASDALQETFIKLHGSCHLFNHELPFLPWLFTITKNICTDILRREGRYPKTVLLNEEIASVLPSRPDTNELLDTMMEKLSSKDQQRAIHLRYFEDWSFEEVAEQLKTTPAKIKRLLQKVLAMVVIPFNGIAKIAYWEESDKNEKKPKNKDGLENHSSPSLNLKNRHRIVSKIEDLESAPTLPFVSGDKGFVSGYIVKNGRPSGI